MMRRLTQALIGALTWFVTCTPNPVMAQDANRQNIPRLEASDAFRPPVRGSCSQLTNKKLGDMCYSSSGLTMYLWNGTAWVLAGGDVTQAVLDAHKVSGDHDGRYYTEGELNTSDGDAPNEGSNRVSWNNLVDVPGQFADGSDDGSSGGVATVRETDGSPSVSSATVIEVNSTTGVRLISPGGGVARLSLNTVPDSSLDPITTAGKVANSATTATNIGTPNTIVSRDLLGNFTAGNITAALLGNATTANTATSAITATVANTGDSATSFFSSGLLGVTIGGTGGAPSAANQLLVSDASTAATWRAISDCVGEGKAVTYTAATRAFGCNTITGTGDFVGPPTATDNAIVRFDGSSGALGQNSLVLIGDTGAMTGALHYDSPAHATDGGCVTWKEGQTSGSNTFQLCAANSGLDATVRRDLNANGTFPLAAVGGATINRCIRSGATGVLEVASADCGTGSAASFLDLTDTDPTTYVGQTGKIVTVNGSELGLAFSDAMTVDITSEGAGDLVYRNATGWVNSTDNPTDLQVPTWNAGTNTITWENGSSVTSFPNLSDVSDTIYTGNDGEAIIISGSTLVSTPIVSVDEISPQTGHILIYDGTNSYDNKAVSGVITINSSGATSFDLDDTLTTQSPTLATGECRFSTAVCTNGGMICEGAVGGGQIAICMPTTGPPGDRTFQFPSNAGTLTFAGYDVAQTWSAAQNWGAFVHVHTGAETHSAAEVFTGGPIFNTVAPDFNVSPTLDAGYTLGGSTVSTGVGTTVRSTSSNYQVTPSATFPGQVTATAPAWAATTGYLAYGIQTCSAAGVPLACCTGNDTGTCTSFVTNDTGKQYKAIVSGTSAGSGGPTGTAVSIADNTVTWKYIGLAHTGAAKYNEWDYSPFVAGADGNGDGIDDPEFMSMRGYNFSQGGGSAGRDDTTEYALFEQITWGWTEGVTKNRQGEWFINHVTPTGTRWQPWGWNFHDIGTESPTADVTIRTNPTTIGFAVQNSQVGVGAAPSTGEALQVRDDGIIYIGGTSGSKIILDGTSLSDGFYASLETVNPTAANTVKIPNASGTIAVASSSDFKGVTLWGVRTVTSASFDTGTEVCAASGLVCVTTADVLGTPIACGTTHTIIDQWLAFCKGV